MNKSIIGENAGILWRFLSTDAHKRWELTEVKKGTGMDDMELASAIGWLAREDKNSSTQMGKIKRHTYILC